MRSKRLWLHELEEPRPALKGHEDAPPRYGDLQRGASTWKSGLKAKGKTSLTYKWLSITSYSFTYLYTNYIYIFIYTVTINKYICLFNGFCLIDETLRDLTWASAPSKSWWILSTSLTDLPFCRWSCWSSSTWERTSTHFNWFQLISYQKTS